MDLIYMNEAKEDVNVLHSATLDLAFGADENDFECQLSQANHCCKEDYFLYIEGTEYGGIIDNIGVDTDKREVTYSGRTWHGILNSKILEPDSGADYLVCNGEANTVLTSLIGRMGLNSLFQASLEDSGIQILNYKMHRYVGGYDGIRAMLKASGAKLNVTFRKGFVVLSAKPIANYSQDEQFDTDLTKMSISHKGNPINHVICLGKGDLSKREVIHVYAGQYGNISSTPTYTGLAEVTAVYENTNAANSEELRQGGIDIIREAWNADEIDFDFIADEENFDIGDIVGAVEQTTGTVVAREITKKIVTISNNTVKVSYPTEKIKNSNSARASGGSGGDDTDNVMTLDAIFPVGSTYVTSTNTNPALTLGGTWSLSNKLFKSAYGNSSDGTLFTANADNCSSHTLYYVRDGHSLRIRMVFTTNVDIAEQTATIGKIQYEKLGITNTSYLVSLYGYSSDYDAVIPLTVGYTGSITIQKSVGTNPLPKGASCTLDFTVPLATYAMNNDYCDTFFWRRTK